MSAAAPPVPRVAMVGAGQLAQMTHQAAIGLGVELRVLAERPDEPAVLAGAGHTLAAGTGLETLRAFAAGADVLTFDHELVDPLDLAALEAEGVRVAPSAHAKLHAIDKLEARRSLGAAGFPVPPYAHARSPEEVEAFAADHGWPLIAKTPRGGYDGRGVIRVADAEAARRALADAPDGLLLEPELALERELAVLAARTAEGASVAYPVVETIQRDAMCREVLAPARVDRAQGEAAQALALRVAEHIGAVGVLALELFVTPAGLQVNELALRPHNSGHGTIEGCETSQFEQHLRAVLGLPLGSTALRAPAVATVNVVGVAAGDDPRTRLAAALAVPDAHVHLYAKASRPGRKLGHVTVCGDDLDRARAAALEAARRLEGGAA